ncbi:hypothetical protein BL250_10525 [Erwinia sp. OLTSP20]|uniref:type II secretion system F family protein n=1 Tax=Erwinia sp. OLTSP20 TaxID=1912857 RepID=UPI000C1904BB|nr:type II secretion system F family protein [Erwinia sp. OLTSP20]PIJ92424.1 hypothetical protein BL250_10525 [Erwinia sp. OLTSP20]
MISWSDIEAFSNRMSFSFSKRKRIYSKISRFIDNGVPLILALDTLYEHITSGGKKKKKIEAIAINSWRMRMRNGMSFSQSLKNWVGEEEISVVHSGEISGRLSHALNNVIQMGMAKKEIKKSLFGLIYPVVLLGCLIFYLTIFGTRVVPAFEKILPVSHWVGTGLQMEKLSQFVMYQMKYYIAGVIMIILMILVSLSRWTGKIRTKFDYFPIWTTYRTVIGCQFLISFCALLQAGVATPEIIKILSRYANPWYKEKLMKTHAELLGGASNIGEALAKTKLRFPSDEIIIDLRAYAGLDGFEHMLSELSSQWLEVAVENIRYQLEFFKNIVIVTMGLTFMWIVAGMFSLQQLISSSVQSM